MTRLTFRSLAAHKARFLMTTFAVVLGVGFVVASFVLSDGLRSTFGDLSGDITDGTDLEVRPVSAFGVPLPLEEDLVGAVDDIEGVRFAGAFIEAGENAVQPIKSDGTTIDTFGPPQLAFSWIDDPEVGSFTVVDGRAPAATGEFTMDVDAAADNDFVIGASYDLITPTGLAEDYELVGTTSFGPENDTVGATLMHVTIDDAQMLFGAEGVVDAIPISLEDGADPALVTAALREILPTTGVEVVDNATLTAEQQAEFDEGIDIIGNFLLGFAIVSLFVSIFIIYNTFSIVLGQRVRELGLLRAIGTESRQIRGSVMGEALVVGVIASAVGIGAGVGLAFGLEGLFSALGASLPDSPTILALRTVVFAVVLGVGVTVVSAFAPARAAGRVSPIAAMRDGADSTTRTSRRRIATGGALMIIGTIAGAIGLFGDVGTAGLIGWLGLGAVALFVGVTMISPILARPTSLVLGWPLARLMGRSGHLARENAARNPRRTATTGAALMIGLSLVSAVLVVGESVKTRLGDLIEESVKADYVMLDDSEAGFAPVLADDLAATGQFADISGFRYDDALLNGEVREVSAGELAVIPALFDLDVEAGEIPTNGLVNVMIMPAGIAEDLNVAIGDTIDVEFVSGAAFELELVATYNQTAFEDPVVPHAIFDQAGANATLDWLAANLADGVSTADAAPAIGAIEGRYPQIEVQTAAEFQEQFESTIDSALTVVNAMLALAIIIALIGIANTLALSVSERTRELGLLRAVGMTRRQVRRMVRWEAALVAAFGALLGAVIGVGFGWALVSALPADFASAVSIPATRIVVLMVVAGGAGLVAAAMPARRAGRLNVLDAISQ